MTAACGGGTSGPTFGAAAVVDFSVGALSVYLSQYGASWALRAIPFVGLAPLTLSTFCSTDPPAIPTFTSAESTAITQLSLSPDFFSGLSKLSDLLQHLAWYQLCTCTSGALVPLPAAPAAPAGTPIIQLPPSPLASPCISFHMRSSRFPADGALSTTVPGRLAGGGYTVVLRTFEHSIGLTLWTDTVDLVAMQYNVVYPVVNDVVIATTAATAADQTKTATLAQNADNLRIDWTPAGGAELHDMEVWVDAYCAGAQPGAVQQPCCPPDAATQAQLDAILKMVTLIQRQHVPFAYVAGAAHAGISGIGELSVHGILGLRVDITTVPGRLGQVAGDPVSLWAAGWLSLGTADGFGPRQFITSNPMLLQSISADVTRIGYSIPLDVTITITELVREP